MASYGTKFTFFGGESIYGYRQAHNHTIALMIHQLSDAELFDSDEAKLIHTLTEKSRLRSPVIEFDKKPKPEGVPSNTVPGYRSVRGQTPKQLIKYVLPVKGDPTLLKLAPSQLQMLSRDTLPEGFSQGGLDGEVVVFIEDFGDNAAVVREANAVLENLRVNSERLYQELESYNGSVSGTVQHALTVEKMRRQDERKRQQDLFDQLP